MTDQDFIDRLVTHLRGGSAGGAPVEQNGRGNGHSAVAAEATVATSLTDQEVLKKLFQERGRGAQWESLYNGVYEPYYPSASEAVAALLWKLAFYTGKDQVQMGRLVRRSALASSKFDERRGGSTWIAQEIDRAVAKTDEVFALSAGRRSLSSSSLHTADDDNEGIAKVVWFSELGEPAERKYIIEKIGVKGYPIVAFGAGGVAKSFVMLSAGIAVASASGVDEWLGLRVLEHGHVLYLDFELDVDEQLRRVRDLCNGLGVLVPQRLAYLSGVGLPAKTAFDGALSFVRDHEAKAVIIDSMGLALEGDMERGKDVLAFHKRYVDPLRRAGATPFIVDHEGKLQAGEKHRHKSPIGSAYKAWAARSVLQFELEEHDKENAALDIRVRQTKTNFTPIDPFGVRLTFQEKKVTIKPFELVDSELVEEETVPVRERILGALRVEPATNADLQKLTGASAGTIRNNLSALMQSGEVGEDGYIGRSKVYRLLSSSGDVHRKDRDDDNNETPEQRIIRLLDDPPGWLANQLGECRQDPDRFIRPTAAAIAAEVYGDALRWKEVAPTLEAGMGNEVTGKGA